MMAISEEVLVHPTPHSATACSDLFFFGKNLVLIKLENFVLVYDIQYE